MERQEILNRQQPPRIVAILDEAALRRVIGTDEVMRGQLNYLIELAERPNITLQIVPASVGAYAGLPGAFTILSFANGPDVVYIEGHVGGQVISDSQAVREHEPSFDLIRGAAISADDSLKLLHSILEDL
jgi:hypothetical protein